MVAAGTIVAYLVLVDICEVVIGGNCKTLKRAKMLWPAESYCRQSVLSLRAAGTSRRRRGLSTPMREDQD